MSPSLRLPLRTLLPLVLLILLFVQGAFIWSHTRSGIAATLQDNARTELRLILSRLQGTIQYLANTEQYDQAIAEISGLGADISLQYGLLISEHDRIIASTRLAELTEPIAKVIEAGPFLDQLLDRIAEVRRRGQGVFWTTPGGNLAGAYPVVIGSTEAALRPDRIGVLIVVRDLSQVESLLTERLLTQTLPIALALGFSVLVFGLFLHFIITQRISILMGVAQRGSQGTFTRAIPVHGRDEVANLARSLEEMFRQIDNARTQLQRSEQLYAQAQAAAHIASWEWDIASGKVAASDPLGPMFGYVTEPFPGTIDAMLARIHPDDVAGQQAAMRRALTAVQDYKTEYRVVRPDGNVRWFATIGDVVRDEQGKSLRVLGIAQDITERKSAEQALRDSEVELKRHRDHLEDMVAARTVDLEAALKELEAFSYSVSHDLRTPLRAISGFSEVIEEDYQDRLDERGRDYLKRVRLGAQRMALLIDDLLNLSRVTRGGLKREEINIGKMIAFLLKEMQQDNPSPRVELECKCESSVLADPKLTHILLSNLVSNAVKFTSKVERPRIECGTLHQNGETVFYVRDNGVGFDMRYASKLFGPFQRMHSKDEFEGSGIGLATAHRIIRRHGGNIWAESAPGKGTTFYFTFGRQSAAESDAESASDA